MEVKVYSIEDRCCPLMNSISRRFETPVEQAFVGLSAVDVPVTIIGDWVEENHINAGRCCRCVTWATDRNTQGHLADLVTRPFWKMAVGAISADPLQIGNKTTGGA